MSLQMFAIIAKKKTHSRLPTATHLNINLCSQDEARKMNRRVSRLCFSRAHGVVVSHPLRMRKALGSNPSVSIFAKRALMRKPFAAHAYSPTVKNDPGRTRTCNLWFRRPTPYPLGHRASCYLFRVVTLKQRGSTAGQRAWHERSSALGPARLAPGAYRRLGSSAPAAGANPRSRRAI